MLLYRRSASAGTPFPGKAGVRPSPKAGENGGHLLPLALVRGERKSVPRIESMFGGSDILRFEGLLVKRRKIAKTTLRTAWLMIPAFPNLGFFRSSQDHP